MCAMTNRSCARGDGASGLGGQLAFCQFAPSIAETVVTCVFLLEITMIIELAWMKFVLKSKIS